VAHLLMHETLTMTGKHGSQVAKMACGPAVELQTGFVHIMPSVPSDRRLLLTTLLIGGRCTCSLRVQTFRARHGTRACGRNSSSPCQHNNPEIHQRLATPHAWRCTDFVPACRRLGGALS